MPRKPRCFRGFVLPSTTPGPRRPPPGGARQRSGEALLEAARWLSEARAEAQHGEWRVFLEATNTSDDTAE